MKLPFTRPPVIWEMFLSKSTKSLIVGLADYMVGRRREITEADFEHKSLTRDDVVRVLFHTSQALDGIADWERDTLFATCQGLADALSLKFRDYLFPLFVAIGGRGVTLPLFDSLIFLGSDVSRVRIREALDVFAVSKKERKRLEKERLG